MLRREGDVVVEKVVHVGELGAALRLDLLEVNLVDEADTVDHELLKTTLKIGDGRRNRGPGIDAADMVVFGAHFFHTSKDFG